MSLLSTSFSDPLGRYYTCDRVSELLVSFLSIKEPKLVLDLGSGDGALSKAAAKRWTDAQFITVDIENVTTLVRHQYAKDKLNHKHFIMDALEPSLISNLGLVPEGIDLAICNPPFIKPKWKKEHQDFLIKAGYPQNLKAIKKISAEIIFIIQNLLSLKKGGQLGLIIPDGFVSGEKNRKFREFILNRNAIDKVIKLPRNAFVGTNVQAHIVIITKGSSNKSISIEDFNFLGDKSKEVIISKENAIDSLDYTYHQERKRFSKHPLTLSELGCIVTRGRINSKQCRCSKQPILHTTDLIEGVNELDLSSFVSEFNSDSQKHIVAVKGDILIARVGRNLTSKIGIVNRGSASISDCIYRLSAPLEWRGIILDYLISKDGQLALNSRVHGAGARYLSMRKLLDMPIPNY